MALSRLPYNPSAPIPNNPFYAPETTYFRGPYYNADIVASSGITIQTNGTVLVTGGGGGGTLTSVSGVSPINVASPTTAPVISVDAASTTGPGVVQLSDSVTDDVSTTAATSRAVKLAYDLAAGALQTTGGTMTGDIVFSSTQTIPLTALPLASNAAPGIVQIGSNITLLNCTISVETAAECVLGVVRLVDSFSCNSPTAAVSANALKQTYDLASSALPLTGGTMTGIINFAPGQQIPATALPVATTTVRGAVCIGDNITVDANGLICVLKGSCSNLGVLQVGCNLCITGAGILSVCSASTTQAGIVQLTNSLTSTSIDTALTAAQGQCLQQQINALVTSPNIVLAGTFDAAIAKVVSVTSAGTARGYVVGGALPSADATTVDSFVIVTTPGTVIPPGGTPTPADRGDWFLVSQVTAGPPATYAWEFLNVGPQILAASTTQAGIVALATDAETQAGTDGTIAVTPLSLQSKLSDSCNLTSSTTIASSTAVKAAYTLASCALPLGGGQMTGLICFAAGQTFPSGSIADATCITKGIVQIGTNIAICCGVISVADASTSTKGVVTLTDAVNSTCSNLAATALAVKTAYDKAVTAEAVACSALPKAGGTMTGNIQFAPTQVFPATGLPIASTTAKGVVQIGNNIQVDAGGLICVRDGAVGTIGVVELYDGIVCNSITTAATPKSVCCVFCVAETKVPLSAYPGKGDLLVGTTVAGAPTAFSPGADNTVLTADSACSTGLKWVSTANSIGSLFTGKGQLLSACASGVSCIVPAGTLNGQVLTVDLTTPTGMKWATAAGTPAATPTALGTVFGCTDAVSKNTLLGINAGCAITSGSANVAIGPDVQVASPTGVCQLAIGYNATCNWLTGDSNKNIRPGAGVVDCAGTFGCGGQVLTSTGGTLSGGIVWSNSINGICSASYYRQVSATTTNSLDWATNAYKTIAVSTPQTISFANPPAAGVVGMITVQIAVAVGGGPITWPAAVKWPGGTAPTLTAGKTHLIMLSTSDGGTTILASSLVDYTV